MAKGAKPGHPKYGGRKKGTPNKQVNSLFTKCEEMGIDPFDELLKLCCVNELSIKMTAIKEVCQYLYPKRKSLEHSGNIDPSMIEAAENIAQMSREERIAILKEELKAIEDVKS